MPLAFRLLLPLLLFAPQLGAVELIDRDGQLERLARFMGRTDWASSIRCGERQSFFRSQIRCDLKCSQFMCVDSCTDTTPDNNTFDLAVEECTNDSAAIYGTNNFEAYINRSDFESIGSWVHALVAGMDHFSRPTHSVEIFSGFHRTVTLIEDGKMRKEQGYALTIELRTSPNSMAQIYDLVFLSRQSVLGSLVYFGNMHNQYFLKRKGVASVR